MSTKKEGCRSNPSLNYNGIAVLILLLSNVTVTSRGLNTTGLERKHFVVGRGVLALSTFTRTLSEGRNRITGWAYELVGPNRRANGAGLGEVFERGETPNLGIIFEPFIIGPIIGLCVLAALPILIKAVRGKKGL